MTTTTESTMTTKEIAEYALVGLREYADRLYEFAENDPENRDSLIAEYNDLAGKFNYLWSLCS